MKCQELSKRHQIKNESNRESNAHTAFTARCWQVQALMPALLTRSPPTAPLLPVAFSSTITTNAIIGREWPTESRFC